MAENTNFIDLGISTDISVIDQFLTVKGKFLIDAGCGAMNLSKAFADRGASVLAIDPDPIQAEKNRQAETIDNVGFAETGAEAVPVEDASVDGVVFPYSLHHIPHDLYEEVLTEICRILKPDGFVYVIEPVAQGEHNTVVRLFHDESAVRAAAQTALDTLFKPRFKKNTQISYRSEVKYGSWDEFADKYSKKSFNTGYTEAQIRTDKVKSLFLELGEPVSFRFESPMRVTFMEGLIPLS